MIASLAYGGPCSDTDPSEGPAPEVEHVDGLPSFCKPITPDQSRVHYGYNYEGLSAGSARVEMGIRR